MTRIGIQGGETSYHEIAAHQLHGQAKLTYYETFSDLFVALRRKQIDRTVVAIANNRVQFIPESYEELTKHAGELDIIAETYLRVEHCLLAPKGATLETIKEVHSQAPAIGQCREFLEQTLPQARIVEQHDTAASARMVAQLGDSSKAAIASAKAGELYGLSIVKTSIQDDPANITRFLEITLAGLSEPIKGANKTTLMLKTKERPGALVDALVPFKREDINLSNLHSRIIPNTAFDMVFFLEFDAGLNEDRTKQVLYELRGMGDECLILGSYKSAPIPINEV